VSSIFPGAALGVALGFLIGISVHHFVHARVATAMGDRTPRLMGRLSLSIRPHVDPLGTVIMPIVWVIAVFFGGFFPMFGWGKAQSLNPTTRRSRRDTILIALAGPAGNLVVAFLAAVAWRFIDGRVLREILGGVVVVGVFMTVWEILPLPGRDGGRILAEFLSPSAKLKMQDLAQYEVLFLVGVFLILQVVIFGIANPMCNLLTDRPCGLTLFQPRFTFGI